MSTFKLNRMRKEKVLLWFLLEYFICVTVVTSRKPFRKTCCKKISRKWRRDDIYYSQNWTKYEYIEPSVCMNSGCVKAACTISRNMDLTVDPCEDFYNFACGSFIKNSYIPDDKSSVNIPHSIGDALDFQLRHILEDSKYMNHLRAFRLAKKLYSTCMDIGYIEQYSVLCMKNHLRIFGGWPVLLNNWDERNFNWETVTYALHKTGFGSSYLFRLYVFLDPKNSSRTVLFIHQALLGLKREYLSRGIDDKLVRAYYKYMVDVAVLLGSSRTRAKNELRESLNFELTLAKISLPKEELRNFTKLYNPLTIGDLQHKYPTINWLRYINTIIDGTEVDENEIVILQSPNYIAALEKLLRTTPKSMPVAIGALYVRKYFDTESKQQAIEMVANIRYVLKNILQNVEWMDHQTKQRALEKLEYMQSYVGYPDELLSDELIDQFHQQLNSSKQYLEAVLEITKFERLFEFRSLHAPVNKSGWVDHASAAIVNAFYTFSENSINLPAGILQGAFFSSDRPKYMNYGAIGTVIGHEIIHGYDDKGRQYDKDGNLVDWWLPPTEKSFICRAQCFIDQYSSYMDPQVDLYLNGINTQGENMADNGGVKAAYRAYMNWVSLNGPEPKLPGLNYNPEQLFWLSLANAFCTKSRPEYMKLIITTDEHSPAMFRVLGSLSNNPDFARDFNCPPQSNMNPRHKCVLW